MYVCTYKDARQILCHILSVNFTNFFSVNCVCSGGARLHPEMIEIALKYSMAAMHIPMPFDICCQIDSLSLVWYHRHHKPPHSLTKFEILFGSFEEKLFSSCRHLCRTHLFYYLLFVLAKHIFEFCYRMSFPPCCISYILDHLWRNIILEMCMYF